MDLVKSLQSATGCSEELLKKIIVSSIEETEFPQNLHHNHIVKGTRVVVYPVKLVEEVEKIPYIIGLQKECPVERATHKFKSIIKVNTKNPEVKEVMKKYSIPFITKDVVMKCENVCKENLLEFC